MGAGCRRQQVNVRSRAVQVSGLRGKLSLLQRSWHTTCANASAEQPREPGHTLTSPLRARSRRSTHGFDPTSAHKLRNPGFRARRPRRGCPRRPGVSAAAPRCGGAGSRAGGPSSARRRRSTPRPTCLSGSVTTVRGRPVSGGSGRASSASYFRSVSRTTAVMGYSPALCTGMAPPTQAHPPHPRTLVSVLGLPAPAHGGPVVLPDLRGGHRTHALA